MAMVTCSYCGAEYDNYYGACPQCGNDESKTNRKSSGNHGNDGMPHWMLVVACVVLAIAVLIGIAAFVVKMGFLDGTFSLEGPALTLIDGSPESDSPQAQTQQTQEDLPVEEDGACVELTLNHEEIVFERQGQRVFLAAVPRPAECEEEIIFTSSDEEIADVSPSGLVEAIAPGETEIVVTCGEITKTCSVVCDFEVIEEETEEEESEETEEETEDTDEEDVTEQTEENVAPLEVVPADFTLFYYGEKARLSLKNVPDGAVVTYSSSNPAVVSVSADGVVEAKMNQPGSLYGTAQITIMVNDVKLTSTARCDYSSTAEE